MIPGRIAPHPPSQGLARVKPQGEGRHRGTKYVANRSHYRIGDHDRPEMRRCEDCHRTRRQHGERRDKQSALGPGLIDQAADRRLHRQTQQPANRSHQPDCFLAPMLLGDQKDVQIRPKRAAHIGEQKIERVERIRFELGTVSRAAAATKLRHPDDLARGWAPVSPLFIRAPDSVAAGLKRRPWRRFDIRHRW